MNIKRQISNKVEVTKRDVAKFVGVSHMSVTRALRGGSIKEETKKRILEACEILKYNPNLLAYGLTTKKSLLLGVIVATFRHSYYADIIDSIERTAEKFQYHIIGIESSNGINVSWKQVSFLLSRKIDGIIICAPCEDIVYNRLAKSEIPILLVDSDNKDYKFNFVGTLDIESAEEAVSYLIKLGHRKIAHLGGLENSYTGKRRLEGYKRALLKNNIKYNENLVIFTNYHLDGGYEGTKNLFERGIKFSAIFAANDYIAIGTLAYLYEKKISCPEDISVIGFTGDEIGKYTCPQLTTMKQSVEEVGQKAVEIILSPNQKEVSKVEKIFLPVKLIIRNSCCKI